MAAADGAQENRNRSVMPWRAVVRGEFSGGCGKAEHGNGSAVLSPASSLTRQPTTKGGRS